MPIYEHACCACGHKFETLVRASKVPQCPDCQSNALGKQRSAFSANAPNARAPMMQSPCGQCPNPSGSVGRQLS